MDNSSLSHTKWDCTYHIVFIPKYRRKVMYGELRTDVREIIIKLCEYKGVAIVEGSVCIDHVHLCVKIPPKLSVSEFMGYFYRKEDFIVRNTITLGFAYMFRKNSFHKILSCNSVWFLVLYLL